MSSVVEICNRALQKLGAGSIVDIADDSVKARACNLCYDVLRRAELRKYAWSFATKRTQLAEDVTAPAFGKAHSYPLPSDWIQNLPPDPYDNTPYLDWEIEGKSILTDYSSPLNLRYTADITDPNVMDSLFREGLATVMALEMCESLTQSNTKKASLDSDYKAIISEAKGRNAIEKIAQQFPNDTWLEVRR